MIIRDIKRIFKRNRNIYINMSKKQIKEDVCHELVKEVIHEFVSTPVFDEIYKEWRANYINTKWRG